MSVLRYFITSKAKRSVLKLFLSHTDSEFYTREIARLTGEPLNAVRRELGYLEKAGLLRSHMQGNLKYYGVVSSFPVLAEWQKIILFTPNIDEDVTAPAVSSGPHIRQAKAVEQAPVEAEEIAIAMEESLPAEEVRLEARESAVAGTGAETIAGETGSQPDIVTVSAIVNILRNEFNPISTIALAIIYGDAARSENVPEGGVDLLVVGDISRENLLELLTDIEDDTGVSINMVRMTRSDFDYRNAKGDPLIRRIWSEPKRTVKGRH